MDFNVVLWGNRLRAVSARPYKALAKSLLPYPTIIPAEPKKAPLPTGRGAKFVLCHILPNRCAKKYRMRCRKETMRCRKEPSWY